MKVAVLSYPMLFQTRAGLSMKVRRTVDALKGRGVDARLFDTVHERLTDYDLVHVFAAYNGNNRIVEQAKNDGLPVVMSTILNPPFSKWQGRLARFLTRAVGKLSHWEITTTYRQLVTGMEMADHLVALGATEREMLIRGYGLPAEKISIVHNGIGAEFFLADATEFSTQFPEIRRPFVLHTGIVGDVKNQLGLVQALAREDIDIVLVGYAGAGAMDYLQRCRDAGRGRVHHLGELPHGHLIASACAAAAVMAIPSRHEGMPNSILEALAADRPVVLTDNHSMDFALPARVATEVNSSDAIAIRKAVMNFVHQPPPSGAARSVVKHLNWDAVGDQLKSIYQRLL